MAGSFSIPTSGSHVFSWIILLLPALALTTSIGVGLIEVAVWIGMVVYARPLWLQRATLFESAGWIIAAFAFNLTVAVISLLSSGFEARFLENPAKMLLLAPAIGLVALTRPQAEWIWHGLFIGTVGAACFAFYQRFGLDLPRAQGFSMAIMFGDIAMAMGLMSLAGIHLFANTRWAILPYAAFFAGVTASMLSGTRGGWIALLFAFIPLYSYGSRHISRRRILILALSGIALLTAAGFIPQFGVGARFAEIHTDLYKYLLGDPFTPIGTRLEMWKGAWIMFLEHPLAGVGRANFHQALNELIARGDISPVVHFFRHAHNELFHALATEGILGAGALMFLYLAPLAFFIRHVRRHDASHPYALAGLLLVLSFIDFGLTQVLFSHHVGAAFYAAAISMLAGICIRLKSEPAPID